MTAATLADARPAAEVAGAVPDLFHRVCCDDDHALCGADVSGCPWGPLTGEQFCVVCDELDKAIESCGAPTCPYREVS